MHLGRIAPGDTYHIDSPLVDYPTVVEGHRGLQACGRHKLLIH